MAIRLTGLSSGLDTESIISELVSAYRTKEDKYVKAQTSLTWKQAIWKSLNVQVNSLYKTAGNLRLSDAWTAKTTTISNSNMATVKAATSAVNGSQSLKIEQLAKASYITGGQLTDTSTGTTATKATTLGNLGISSAGTITVKTGNGTTSTDISVTASTTLSDLANSISAITGAKASYDDKNGRLFVSASNSGQANAVTLTDSTGTSSILSALKLAGSDASIVTAQDAKINLNNAEYTSSSNEFVVNGLTIDCMAETGTSTLSITTATDTQAMYDKVKDFFTQYNTLINTMTAYYNADSAKGYEPLTSAEKSSMSDTEVEAWEAKIKSSLLRRDDTVSNVSSIMENSMASAYYVYNGAAVSFDSDKDANYYVCNGAPIKDASNNNITDATALKTWADANGAKKYSLSSFGIGTLGVLNAAANQENAYHIDGDSDDTSTSTKTDKLLAALTSDPDSVQAVMKQVTSDLYNNLGVMLTKSTKLRSIYTIYNDKEMAQEYSDYTTTISDWETKLNDMQDYYYSKFASMESALATLKGQQSSLSSLLG